jgi:hypothetical protein
MNKKPKFEIADCEPPKDYTVFLSEDQRSHPYDISSMAVLAYRLQPLPTIFKYGELQQLNDFCAGDTAKAFAFWVASKIEHEEPTQEWCLREKNEFARVIDQIREKWAMVDWPSLGGGMPKIPPVAIAAASAGQMDDFLQGYGEVLRKFPQIASWEINAAWQQARSHLPSSNWEALAEATRIIIREENTPNDLNTDLETSRLTLFDDFEVHPVALVGRLADGRAIIEPCEENDPSMIGWSLYGHCPMGGLECLKDFTCKEDAIATLERLRPLAPMPPLPTPKTGHSASIKR